MHHNLSRTVVIKARKISKNFPFRARHDDSSSVRGEPSIGYPRPFPTGHQLLRSRDQPSAHAISSSLWKGWTGPPLTQ